MTYQVENTMPLIYTTGAFLRPMQVKDANGNERWIWYVTEFEDGDSFYDGNVYNPREVAGSLEELLVDTTAEIYEKT
ncbi:MAG: hypothetical protein LBH00_04520 [Planctomycetaceae bacterium]|jgi:hypothetical protein|nr:hypothetical protein [Planctomycetaceae bacterium]